MKTHCFKVLFVLTFVFAGSLFAQTSVLLNNTNNGTTRTGCNFLFYDDGGASGNYTNSQDRTITFCPSSQLQRIVAEVNDFNLASGDTLKIYEGTSTLAQVVINDNDGSDGFTGNSLNGLTIASPITNPTGCLTFNFKSDDQNVASGWKIKITCEDMCQDVVVALDTFYSRIDSMGVTHTLPLKIDRDSSLVRGSRTDSLGNVIVDTVINGENWSWEYISFYALNMCLGDSMMIINALPQFPYSDYTVTSSTGADSVVGYHQTPNSCIYYWSFGDEQTAEIHGTPVAEHHYAFLQGYNLTLAIVDTTDGHYCTSKNAISARVRVAKNPIKTVSKLPDMCSGDKQQMFVGYSANSTIITDTIAFSQAAKEEYNTRTFIPDTYGGTQCYEAPVTFTTFTPGATVDNEDEVISICIAIEHSFLGDLGFFVECPNGQSVTLKYNTHINGVFLGIPNENDNIDGGGMNDSNANPIGTCWNYCFSNQYLTNAQGVITGASPNHMVNSGYSANTVDSTHIYDSSYYFQTPIQGLTGTQYNQANYNSAITVDLNGFNELVGCPLNGEWKLRVCDNWGSDNGWVCSWWMELGKNSSTDWTYQVPIDTVIWEGPFISSINSTTGEIAPPIDASGEYVYGISIIDAFGCPWDTVTTLNVVRTPVVDLGADTSFCEGGTMVLDAGNSGAFKYDWEPTGENTQQITVHLDENVLGQQQYIAQVTNYNGMLYCYGLDTINITINAPALASFTSDIGYMEGCEPLQLQLRSTSSNASNFYWVVGDQTSTDVNPYFELTSGSYDLMLAVESADGCKDTISYQNIINVFKNPVADFGWNPAMPSATDPTVTMINLTTPEISSNRYHWQFQTNKNDETSIVNIMGYSPTYTWTPQSGESVAGDYSVILDAYTYNESPSGRVYECHDTITKLITIVNDNIMFPTVVTPNGDGINDVFEIHNLIDGQAFPDNELAIYNRYGKRIYFIQDLRNKEDFWDPEKTNSPTGTYFYRFIGRGPIRNVEFKGSVEVLRDK